tara:strand:- start:553 stop:987 length:435 start_codon:yes stop_codon:yes gene_type:complete
MLSYIYELYNSYLSNTKFYYLSLIKEDDGSYSIHGLWPQYSLNSYPSYCKTVNFSIEKINPIMDRLNKYWYSSTGLNADFWKHEYEKHGSCVFVPMTELSYFKKTIELYEYSLVHNIIKRYSEKNPESKKILIPFDTEFKYIGA